MAKLKMSLIDTGSPRDELNEPLGIEMIAGAVNSQFRESVEVDLKYLQKCNFVHSDKSIIYDKRIIGISTKLGSYNQTKNILNVIKEYKDDPLIVIGDLLPTFAYKQLLKEHNNILCIRGEGEDAIIDIVDKVMKNPSELNDDIMLYLYKRETPNISFFV